MAPTIRAAEMASATISSTQLNGTTWQYNLVLDDIGTTNIGTFWFSWIPGEDFMPVNPTSVTSATSWTDNITHAGGADGYAIQWLAGSGAALTPGNSLAGFSFDSTATPTQMQGNSSFFPSEPVATSFVYIGAPFSDPGFQFAVQTASSTAPEPSNGTLAVIGVGVLFIFQLLRRGRRFSCLP